MSTITKRVEIYQLLTYGAEWDTRTILTNPLQLLAVAVTQLVFEHGQQICNDV